MCTTYSLSLAQPVQSLCDCSTSVCLLNYPANSITQIRLYAAMLVTFCSNSIAVINITAMKQSSMAGSAWEHVP